MALRTLLALFFHGILDDLESYSTLVGYSSLFTRIQPELFVVIDPIDGLERAVKDQYLSFINALKHRLRETDSIGVFHGLDTEPIPDARRLTLHHADAVWGLEQPALSREIKTRLLNTKARRG